MLSIYRIWWINLKLCGKFGTERILRNLIVRKHRLIQKYLYFHNFLLMYFQEKECQYYIELLIQDGTEIHYCLLFQNSPIITKSYWPTMSTTKNNLNTAIHWLWNYYNSGRCMVSSISIEIKLSVQSYA